MKWKTISKKEVDLIEELKKLDISDETILHIGTDAQARGKTDKADFVTVVCVHSVFKGARVFYWKDKDVSFFSLWDKLYGETERSLRVAQLVSKGLELNEFNDKILVHVDANPNPLYKSSSYVKSLAGMVVGYGFKHVLKPDAWAASHAADHIVKNKN